MTASTPDPGRAYVRLLGQVALVSGDGTVSVPPSASQRRLLAVLALHRRETVRSLWLADRLGVSPGALRNTVMRVRRLVGEDALRTDAVGYCLELDVDIDHFTSALARAGAKATDQPDAADGPANERGKHLDAALAFWRGDALDEFATEDWARGEVLRLDELRTQAAAERAAALLDGDRASAAVASLETHIARTPLDPRLRHLQMRALDADGRRADALRAYHRYRDLLIDETGTEPPDDIRALERRIATDEVGDDPTESKDLIDATDRRHPVDDRLWRQAALPSGNLVVPATDWVGPTEHLDRLVDDLRSRRLVTLCGPGGIGKTRTAIEIGHRVGPAFADGTWMVELASITDGADVTAAISSGLDIRSLSKSDPAGPIGSIAAIVDWLSGRALLIILDNCEHVIEAASAAATAIVRRCPTVTILATSRERLGIGGERVVTVPALSEGDSVELFCERARTVDGDAHFDERDREAIAAICEQIDRIPLAIELAAARTRSLAPTDLLARLGDRFQLLRAVRPDHLDRHHALRATVDWSYQLLDPAERLLFDRMSVFAGSFDLASIEAVCADEAIAAERIVDLVATLVDKSMIERVRRGRTVRYRLLMTLRSYAHERLAERAEVDLVRYRQVCHAVELAEATDRRWMSAEQVDADHVFDVEWDDLRAAFSHSLAVADLDHASRLFTATLRHAMLAMRTEHGDWAEMLVAAHPHPVSLGASVLSWAAWWSMVTGGAARAVELAELAVQGSEPDDQAVSLAFGVQAFVLWSLGRPQEGTPWADRLRGMLPTLDEWYGYHAERALFAFERGEAMWQCAERLAAIAERTCAPMLISSARYYQGSAALYASDEADCDTAIQRFRSGIELVRDASVSFPECQNLLGLLEATVMQRADDVGDVARTAMRRLFDRRYWLFLFRGAEVVALMWAQDVELEGAALVLGHLVAHDLGWRRRQRQALTELVDAQPGMAAWRERGAAMSREDLLRSVLARLSER